MHFSHRAELTACISSRHPLHYTPPILLGILLY